MGTGPALVVHLRIMGDVRAVNGARKASSARSACSARVSGGEVAWVREEGLRRV